MCSSCQHTVAKLVGRCPECGTWGSMDEAPVLAAVTSRPGASLARAARRHCSRPHLRRPSPRSTARPRVPRRPAWTNSTGSSAAASSPDRWCCSPVNPAWASRRCCARWSTGGPPAAPTTARCTSPARSRRDRCACARDRTGAVHERVYLAAESDLATVLGHVEQVRPTLLIVDSVQTMLAADVDGVVGVSRRYGPSRVALTSLAKASACRCCSSATSPGRRGGRSAVARAPGRRRAALRGDKHSTLRMIRGIKNRSAPPTRWAASNCARTASSA